MPPRRKPRRGGARLEQEGNNPGGNGTPNQFVVDFVAALAAANILNQPRVDAELRAREITKDFRRMNPPSFDGSSTDPLKEPFELPRDNVRNARGNEGRQSMGSGGMASGSQGSQSRKRQRDTFQPTQRLIVHRLHHSLDLLHHRILRHRVLALGVVALATWLGFAHRKWVHVVSLVQFSSRGRVRVLVRISRGVHRVNHTTVRLLLVRDHRATVEASSSCTESDYTG
ncbi:hypothetical protein Acr_21g0004420 [Actinidia rufa]|uniref:Uncharacterized protein n=1 Tax=Actinidia rufa TaxID=165716 RepID=A0A7J0GG97_9ERIC|nr:hypothetical protein Acr_21g0004420 [Actinidia rufa]